MDKKQLIEEAIRAKQHAYAPYSGFKVGCSLLLKDGTVIHGANVENVSYGLTNCAERSALFSAYSRGYRKEDVIGMAIVSDSEAIISPCGACRQVMLELLDEKTEIILSNSKMEMKMVSKEELLPFSFNEDYIK